jgi:hypothetical protein
MLFMIIEHFHDKNPVPLYKRFQEKGRMMPEGLKYVGSWIESNFDRCFQLMECDNLSAIQEWVLVWGDLCDFEIVPVVPSKETAELVNKYI